MPGTARRAPIDRLRAKTNTSNATNTVTDTATLGGKETDNDQGEEEFTDADGEETSDVEEDTDEQSLALTTTDANTVVDSASVAGPDPTTGLMLTFNFTDQSGGSVTDTDNGNTTNVNSNSTGSSGSAPTTTDTESGENDVTEHDNSSSHSKMSITRQGTEAAGDEVSLQETVTLDMSGTSDIDDDDTESADGTVTENFHEHSLGTAGVTDMLRGSVSTTDPATGVKSTTTLNDFITGNGSDEDRDEETDTTAADGSETDAAADNDSGSETSTTSIQNTTTQANADGSPAGSPGHVIRAAVIATWKRGTPA